MPVPFLGHHEGYTEYKIAFNCKTKPELETDNNERRPGMAVIGRSRRAFGGGFKNYDKNGKKTGTSKPNRYGGYDFYDNDGKKTGYSKRTIIGFDYYDVKGKKTGRAEYVGDGEYWHYDRKGKRIGSSYSTLTRGIVHTDR